MYNKFLSDQKYCSTLINILYDSTCLTSGFPIEQPTIFQNRLNDMILFGLDKEFKFNSLQQSVEESKTQQENPMEEDSPTTNNKCNCKSGCPETCPVECKESCEKSCCEESKNCCEESKE